MVDDVAVPTASTKPPRILLRALTLAGVSAGAWLAFSLTGTANAQSPIDDISSALQGVSESAGQAAGNAVTVVEPLVAGTVRIADPAVAAAAPVVEQAAESVAPVVETAAPVIEQADAVAGPIVESVAEIAAPVVEDVADLSSPALEATAPIVDAVAPIVEATAPIVDAAAPIVDAAAPVLDPLTPVVAATAPVVAPIVVTAAPIVRVGLLTPVGLLPVTSPVAAIAPSSALLQVVESAPGVVFGSDSFAGSSAAGTPAGNALSPSVFTTGSPTGIASGPGRVVTVGSDSLLASDAPSGPLPVPSAPSVPGVPGPVGAPGCPGHSGSGSGGSSSSQVAATTPFGPPSVLANAQFADGDLAAALLTRCEEPGSSPD